MRRRSGESSAIRSIGYDAETPELELEVATKRVYRYVEVPELTYRRWLAASSLGAFYNADIRDAFACREVTRR